MMQLHVNNLSYAYPDGPDVLRDVSLIIGDGESIALIGHNGSGKTTLVKHFNGLLHPGQGEVLLNGRNTVSCKPSQLAAQVALLFQNPDDQICKRTVRAEVAFGPKNLGYDQNRIDSLVQGALAMFDLAAMQDTNPHDLGYSERKRTAMASIVAMDTPLLVFDEPTAGLDHRELMILVQALGILKKKNRTIIVICHDMDFVAENTTRAIVLSKGRKVFDGQVRDLFLQRELFSRCSLLMPQMVQLGQSCNLPNTTLTPAEFIDAFALKQLKR